MTSKRRPYKTYPKEFTRNYRELQGQGITGTHTFMLPEYNGCSRLTIRLNGTFAIKELYHDTTKKGISFIE